jgi:hypothetical protein
VEGFASRRIGIGIMASCLYMMMNGVDEKVRNSTLWYIGFCCTYNFCFGLGGCGVGGGWRTSIVGACDAMDMK